MFKSLIVAFFLSQILVSTLSEDIYCLPGEYLTSNKVCALCSPGCLFCEDITGACTYCSGLIPAWTNQGSSTPGCSCPTSQWLAFNTSASTFACLSSTQANSFYNDTVISAMTTNLTDANILYLKGAAFGVNGNGATAKMKAIVDVLYKAQDVLTVSQINLIELSWTLIGSIYNINTNTYDILLKLVYFSNKIQAANSITTEFTQYFTEFYGLLISRLASSIDYTNATAKQQQVFRQQIQTNFDNFKSIFLKYHDFTEYTEHVYHYSNFYVRIMKATGVINSQLLLGTYRFEAKQKLLDKFPANKAVYFTHFVEQINPFANVTSIAPPTQYVQDIQFFIGENYTTAMSYLSDISNQADLYYPLSNKTTTQLLYWDAQTYTWKLSLANCGKINTTEIYCFPGSLAKSSLYGIQSNTTQLQ